MCFPRQSLFEKSIRRNMDCEKSLQNELYYVNFKFKYGVKHALSSIIKNMTNSKIFAFHIEFFACWLISFTAVKACDRGF